MYLYSNPTPLHPYSIAPEFLSSSHQSTNHNHGLIFFSATIQMASAERLAVSGGGRSSFSQKCSLLSQYLKENGSFGELTLGLITPKSVQPRGTMDLLPMLEKSAQRTALPQLVAGGEILNGAKPEPKNGQMTIFYAGQVMVFNDLPADKAEEIMALAVKSNAAANHHSAALTAESATSTPIIAPTFPQPLGSDLPIARKNSLARFLEKRKDRITANAPYPTGKPGAKAEEWLGLAPRRLSQIPRH